MGFEKDFAMNKWKLRLWEIVECLTFGMFAIGFLAWTGAKMVHYVRELLK